MSSTLSILSLVFGCAAFVATLTTNESSKTKIQKDLEEFGIDLIYFEPDEKNQFNSIYSIKDYLEKYSDDLKKIALEYKSIYTDVRYHNQSEYFSIKGQSPNSFSMRSLKLQEGRFYDETDGKNSEMVVVIGSNIKKRFFPNTQTSVGEYLHLKVDESYYPLRIIGVLQPKGSGADQFDENMYVTPQLYESFDFSEKLKPILIGQLKDKDLGHRSKQVLNSLLKPLMPQGYLLTDAKDAIEQSSKITDNLSLVGIGLAIISLLSGGVGIMNIMLLSVTQRRKEVGLRKALGATDLYILLQFLLESVMICLTGGILGIFLGLIVAKQISLLIDITEMDFSLNVVFISLTFSVLIGIFFGIFPASRASKLDPYEALKS